MSKVLFVSSEAFPFIKTGGLGDVAGSLPRALAKLKQDVRLLLPAYQSVKQQAGSAKAIATLELYNLQVTLLETTFPGSRVKVWLVDCASAFDRPGNPYVAADGKPWDDNAFRFAVFCQAAYEIASGKAGLNWVPDVVHANDWQTGLLPALLSLDENPPATIFTIHNLAYQGVFPATTFFELNLPLDLWHFSGVEFYGQFSFIKGGLAYSDRINTVSKTYADEIQKPALGYGLDGLLHYRREHLSGIINGIDTDIWNPGTDAHIFQTYNRRSLAKKSFNKTALQQQLNLPVDESALLLGMVSRLVEQKGLDLILAALGDLVHRPVQLAILGNGEHYYEQALQDWAARHPEKISVTIGYQESLSHQIEAAADVFLMPSLFEPCGLNQLYSLRYGTLPLVHEVGGLADTVVNTTQQTLADETATGFVFSPADHATFTATIDTCLHYWQQPETWKKIQRQAMSQDYSWQHSAAAYISLYELALSDRK